MILFLELTAWAAIGQGIRKWGWAVDLTSKSRPVMAAIPHYGLCLVLGSNRKGGVMGETARVADRIRTALKKYQAILCRKRFFALTFIAAVASNAQASEVGIGVSAKSDDAWIYVPIDVSAKFRMEPSIRYTSSESTSSAQFIAPPPFVVYSTEAHTVELGIGLFGLLSPHESVRVYYGGRVSYMDGETEVTSEGRIDRSSYDGYRIAPTVGFEYLFNSHFTLGGEAAVYYESLEGTSIQGEFLTKSDFDRNGTATYLVLRYFF